MSKLVHLRRISRQRHAMLSRPAAVDVESYVSASKLKVRRAAEVTVLSGISLTGLGWGIRLVLGGIVGGYFLVGAALVGLIASIERARRSLRPPLGGRCPQTYRHAFPLPSRDDAPPELELLVFDVARAWELVDDIGEVALVVFETTDGAFVTIEAELVRRQVAARNRVPRSWRVERIPTVRSLVDFVATGELLRPRRVTEGLEDLAATLAGLAEVEDFDRLPPALANALGLPELDPFRG